MSTAFFILGGCFFLFLAWFLYYRSIELFACLLIAMNFDFFYLAPLIGKFPIYRLFAAALVILLVLIRLLQGELSLGRYGAWLLLMVPIVLVGIMQAYFSGQTVILGIKAAKFIPLLLAYFLFAGRDFDIQKFALYGACMAVGVVLIVDFIMASGNMQYFIGLNRKFDPSQITTRLGKTRIGVGSLLIATGGIMALARFLHDKRRVVSLVLAVVLLLHIIMVVQTRMLIIAMLGGMFLLIMIDRRFSPFMIVGLLLAALLIVPAWDVISSSIMQKSELAMLTAKEFKKNSGSVGARAATYEFYGKEMRKHSLLGTGMLNFNWEDNPERKMQQKGFHLSDIGLIHFFFTTGILGLIWFIPGFLRLWLDILRVRGGMIAAGYIIMATIAMPTLDLFLRGDTMLLFGIFCALLSNAVAFRQPELLPVPTPNLA